MYTSKRRMRHVERVCGAEEYFILPNRFLPGPAARNNCLKLQEVPGTELPVSGGEVESLKNG